MRFRPPAVGLMSSLVLVRQFYRSSRLMCTARSVSRQSRDLECCRAADFRGLDLFELLESDTSTVLVCGIVQSSEGDPTILFSRGKPLNGCHKYLSHSKFNFVAIIGQPLPLFVA